MPFTLSHPAAVVPLAQNPHFVFSALVIGSMSPDFESFLHLSTDVTFAHSLPGIAIFCLPSGILIFLLFHMLLKRPLLSLAPRAHQQRLLPLMRDIRLQSPRQWASILISMTLGTVTHLIWDAATHEYGWIVQRVSFLQAAVLPIGGNYLKIYTFLQHGGSLVGGIILVYCYWDWYNTSVPREWAGTSQFSERQKYGIISAMLIGGGTVGMVYAAIRSGAGIHGAHFLKDTVLLGIPAVCLGALIFSVIYVRINPYKTSRNPSTAFFIKHRKRP